MFFNPCLKQVVFWPWTRLLTYSCLLLSGREVTYQRLLRADHVSDESASTDVILEISTNFYLKPIK